MTATYDVLVSGAGLSGRLCALVLAHHGFSVLLADKRAPEPADDGRTTAIAYAGVRVLERLGLWQALAPDAAPMRKIAVTQARPRGLLGAGGAEGAGLFFSESLLPDEERWAGTPLAYVAENAAIARVLAAACAEAPGVTQAYGAGVTALRSGQGAASVSLENGEAVTAALAVACDGRKSPLRRKAGLRAIEQDFGQRAVTYVIGHDQPHDGVARQAFLPGGPFAVLPLPGGRSSIVWSMPKDKADAVLAADEATLLQLTEDRLGGALGTLSLETGPRAFPLRFLFAPDMAADRLALMGDAAHVVHPIAGQGFNLAIKDAAVLGDVLAEARGLGLDIGHGTVLARYSAWRRAEVTAMAFGTGALARLLSTEERVTRAAVGFGFGLVNRSAPLKRFFAKEAGQDGGRLPSLMAPLESA